MYTATKIDRIFPPPSISIFAIMFQVPPNLYFPPNISTVRGRDVTSCPRVSSPSPTKFNLSISKILPSRDEKFSRLVGNRLSSKSVYRYMNNFFLSFIIIIIFFLRISFNQRCFRLEDREEEIERELKRKRKES